MRHGMLEQTHYLFPMHAHLFQGHFLAPAPDGDPVGALDGVVPAGGAIVLGVCAAAEAHAAGCMMPLSVFN
ncbi:hypothetical protein TRIUR3_19725 [Triticum urartu]|uniref:Uncharacterized protein n=1 Tax=Triticum urartu TaxID=4572 RepID=M7ZI44_TRIUA|nr:hypothetical protein TRIUR3_19725 [Triticum urartu]